MITQLFEKNTHVNCPPNAYGDTNGVITDVLKTYKQIDETGNFINTGVAIFDDPRFISANSNRTVSGDILTLVWNDNKYNFKFYDFTYGIDSGSGEFLCSQRKLNELNQ